MSGLKIRAGHPPMTRRKTLYDRFKFFTANYSQFAFFDKTCNVSLFYKDIFILRQNSHCLSMFNSYWKEILSKSMGLKHKRLFQSVLKIVQEHSI